MNLWHLLKKDIENQVEKETGKKVKIEEPEKFGDLAFACFSLGKNPAGIAEDLAKKIKHEFIEKTEATGGYVNLYINWGKFGQKLLTELNDNYGSDHEGKTILIDTFQPNPFKAFHIGHVRNAVLGESIRRILEFSGNKTITISFMGDVGMHVAKWLWYFNKFYKGDIPENNISKWAGEIYAEATRKIEENEQYNQEAKELNKKLEEGDEQLIKQWKKIRDLCINDFAKIADELEVRVDNKILESMTVDIGKELIKKLFTQGKLEKSNGAIVINLEKYNLGVFVLLKSDGTALYSTKDMGLFEIKRKKYNFDESIYVVASEQDYYFRQLFKTMEILNIPDSEKNKHISYGLVTLKEGKMSSRKGNVILYEDLRDEAVKRVIEEIEKRNPETKNLETAKKVAFGAIKFSMLAFENNKPIVFDWNAVLDFEGRSGPYLQYTYARCCGILKNEKPLNPDISLLKQKQEKAIIKKIALFPEVVANARKKYSPHIIANYLFELCQNFNTFYQTLPVLKADKELKNARLKLAESVAVVLKTGLNLLGIEAVEKM